MLLFERDTEKAKKNIKGHGVTFDEASTVSKNGLSLTIYDPHPFSLIAGVMRKRTKYDDRSFLMKKS